jgi:hypothetical protein
MTAENWNSWGRIIGKNELMSTFEFGVNIMGSWFRIRVLFFGIICHRKYGGCLEYESSCLIGWRK